MTARPDHIPYDEIADIVAGWPTSRGYGPHIADKYGVPLPTARRWIYQTRLRGMLPSGVAARPCPVCDGTGIARWGNSTTRQEQP